jgi:hypothetical protein
VQHPALGGLDPESELHLINSIVGPLRLRQWNIWSTQVRPELEQHRIFIVGHQELSVGGNCFWIDYFEFWN